MKTILTLAAVGFFLLGNSAHSSDVSSYKSPNGKNSIEVSRGIANGSPNYSISFIKGSKLLFSIAPPSEDEAREIKVSWSPSSEAAILGINVKASENWILVRYTEGKEILAFIDGDELLTEKMFKTLPHKDRTKSYAPVGGVPWETVHWIETSHGTMTYAFHGLGYEGDANLIFDFTSEAPSMKIESIIPAH